MSESTRDMTPEEVAEVFARPREYVMAQVRARRWPHYREGRRVWFTRADVEAIKQLGRAEVTAPAVGSWGQKKGRGAA